MVNIKLKETGSHEVKTWSIKLIPRMIKTFTAVIFGIILVCENDWIQMKP